VSNPTFDRDGSSSDELTGPTGAACRDEPVICPVCGRRVARRMRGQRYCSKRCRQKAHYAKKVARGDFSTRIIARPTSPSKKQRRLNDLQRAKTRSSAHIVGPADVLAIELVGGRPWQLRVGSDGLAVEVLQLRPRALPEARHG
jgi:hypothetical protein